MQIESSKENGLVLMVSHWVVVDVQIPGIQNGQKVD
jgi:hypothetical protein